MSNLQVVIMAAGLGSRYGGLKQIDEFGPSREYLMDYAIYDAYKAGVRKVSVIVRESFQDEIKDIMTAKWKAYKDLAFEFICQETADVPKEFADNDRQKPWGTAHILYVLRKKINSPFLIMNADDYYGRSAISDLVNFLKTQTEQHSLASYRLQKTLSPFGAVTRGLCEVNDGRLIAIDEVSNIPSNDSRDVFVSMNLWGFSPSIFTHVEEYFRTFLKKYSQNPKVEYQIPQMINDLLKDKKVQIASRPTEAEWFGVTYQEDKAQVQQKISDLVKKGEYPSNLFTGGVLS